MLLKEARLLYNLSYKLLIKHVIYIYIYIYLQYLEQSISKESGEISKPQQWASALAPTN